METKKLREKLTRRLIELAEKLEPKETARIAVDIDVTQRTVINYLTGDFDNLETAEAIVVAADGLLAAKS